MIEASVMKKLNHENLVKYIDSFVHDEKFCIVMENCDGGDLDDLINK